MTIICYKNNLLAGDSGYFDQNGSFNFNSQKLFLYKDFAYGFSGDVITIEQYKKYLRKEIKEFKVPEGMMLNAIKVNLKTQEAFKIETQEEHIVEVKVLSKFVAIGVGSEVSLGAMTMGASAIGACKIACKYCSCKEPIYCINTKEKKPTIEKCL